MVEAEQLGGGGGVLLLGERTRSAGGVGRMRQVQIRGPVRAALTCSQSAVWVALAVDAAAAAPPSSAALYPIPPKWGKESLVAAPAADWLAASWSPAKETLRPTRPSG